MNFGIICCIFSESLNNCTVQILAFCSMPSFGRTNKKLQTTKWVRNLDLIIMKKMCHHTFVNNQRFWPTLMPFIPKSGSFYLFIFFLFVYHRRVGDRPCVNFRATTFTQIDEQLWLILILYPKYTPRDSCTGLSAINSLSALK